MENVTPWFSWGSKSGPRQALNLPHCGDFTTRYAYHLSAWMQTSTDGKARLKEPRPHLNPTVVKFIPSIC
jgi:hypothetical protein